MFLDSSCVDFHCLLFFCYIRFILNPGNHLFIIPIVCTLYLQNIPVYLDPPMFLKSSLNLFSPFPLAYVFGLLLKRNHFAMMDTSSPCLVHTQGCLFNDPPSESESIHTKDRT